MRLTTTSSVSRALPPLWGGWVLLCLGMLAISPVFAQQGVNIQKAGKAAGEGIKEGVEGGNSAKAAEAAASETAAEAPAADPAAASTPPPAPDTRQKPGDLPPDASSLDQHFRKKPTAEETKAIIARVQAYMKYHIQPNETDVRQMTNFAGGRPPWNSRAPRTNPYDPQIVKPLPFHQLILDSTPPPPYYPPAGGLKLQSLQEAFQRFLDSSKLVGIVTAEGNRRTAIIVFGKRTVRLRVGDEYDEMDYTIKVKDITTDTVIVQTVGSDLSGILSLTGGGNLYVGEGDRGIVIVSGDEKDKKK